MGIVIPMLLATMFITKLKDTFKAIKKNYDKINKVSGIIMVIMGLYMMISGMMIIFAQTKI